MIARFLTCLFLVTVPGKLALETSCSSEDVSCEAAGHAAKPQNGDVLLQFSKSGLSAAAPKPAGITIEGQALEKAEEEEAKETAETAPEEQEGEEESSEGGHRRRRARRRRRRSSGEGVGGQEGVVKQ
jgi:hypothetical protein